MRKRFLKRICVLTPLPSLALKQLATHDGHAKLGAWLVPLRGPRDVVDAVATWVEQYTQIHCGSNSLERQTAVAAHTPRGRATVLSWA